MQRRLPPMNSVRAFEAVARLESIQAAAEELLVTHGAVSKQIRNLELYIGEPLFVRTPRGLRLTPKGQELAAIAEPAFDSLAAAFSQFFDQGSHKRDCRISTVPSFAAHFLIPRLQAFQSEVPNLELKMSTTMRLVDFSKEKVDLAVRYGSGNYDGLVSERLSRGYLIPVIAGLSELAAVEHGRESDEIPPLLHHLDQEDWRRWARDVEVPGLDPSSGLIIEDINVIYQGVLERQGVALLPDSLVSEDIRTGTLQLWHNHRVRSSRSYYVVYTERGGRKKDNAKVVDWLKAESEKALEIFD